MNVILSNDFLLNIVCLIYNLFIILYTDIIQYHLYVFLKTRAKKLLSQYFNYISIKLNSVMNVRMCERKKENISEFERVQIVCYRSTFSKVATLFQVET